MSKDFCFIGKVILDQILRGIIGKRVFCFKKSQIVFLAQNSALITNLLLVFLIGAKKPIWAEN